MAPRWMHRICNWLLGYSRNRDEGVCVLTLKTGIAVVPNRLGCHLENEDKCPRAWGASSIKPPQKEFPTNDREMPILGVDGDESIMKRTVIEVIWLVMHCGWHVT